MLGIKTKQIQTILQNMGETTVDFDNISEVKLL